MWTEVNLFWNVVGRCVTRLIEFDNPNLVCTTADLDTALIYTSDAVNSGIPRYIFYYQTQFLYSLYTIVLPICHSYALQRNSQIYRSSYFLSHTKCQNLPPKFNRYPSIQPLHSSTLQSHFQPLILLTSSTLYSSPISSYPKCPTPRRAPHLPSPP